MCLGDAFGGDRALNTFLDKEAFSFRLPAARAAVKVRLEKKDGKRFAVIIADCMIAFQAGTEVKPISPNIQIVSEEGEVVSPSKGRRFYGTVSTIDPYHALLEY